MANEQVVSCEICEGERSLTLYFLRRGLASPGVCTGLTQVGLALLELGLDPEGGSVVTGVRVAGPEKGMMAFGG